MSLPELDKLIHEDFVIVTDVRKLAESVKDSFCNIEKCNFASSIAEVNLPNFTSCTIAELRLAIPELVGLKPARNQQKLASLLDKVGAKT